MPHTLYDLLYLVNLSVALAAMFTGFFWLHRPAVGYLAIVFGFTLIGGERLGQARHSPEGDLEISRARVAASGMLAVLPLLLLAAVVAAGFGR